MNKFEQMSDTELVQAIADAAYRVGFLSASNRPMGSTDAEKSEDAAMEALLARIVDLRAQVTYLMEN